MGKVKDKGEVSASKPPKPPAKGKTSGAPKGLFAQFLGSMVRADSYKPMQGRYVRILTAAGLGVLVAVGLLRLYDAVFDYGPFLRYGLPAIVGLVFGWIIYRIVQFPPFAEFMIATEAEMNKVSWTSKDDLYRATTVVLTTVLVLAVFLFFVDWIWTFLLKALGVLKFSGGGGFGSTG